MSFQNIFLYTLVPAVAVVIGSIIAAFRTPGATVRSAIQHLAAGIVFAAVSVELLPDIKHERLPLPIIVGFMIGVGTMLGLRRLTAKVGKDGETQTRRPTSLITNVALDIFIDGLLVGISFAVGATQGALLTFALTIEILFLGLSVSAALCRAEMPRSSVIVSSVGFAALFLVGAFSGATVFSTLKGPAFTIVLAFGLAALLYLVTEELLAEAHETSDTLLTTTTFFVGFLLLLVISTLAES